MQYLRFFDEYNCQTDIKFTHDLTQEEIKQYMHVEEYKSFCFLNREEYNIEDGYVIDNKIGYLDLIEPFFEGEPDYYSVQFYDTIFETVETYTTFKDLLQVKDFYEQNILNGNDKFFLDNKFSIIPQKFGEQYDVMEC